MTQLLTLFIVLNIFNVIIQTVKSIVTVKCGKTIASVVNAIAYGLYTVVTVYTMCDLPLMTKALVVAICNLIGVYVVKWFEEKARKDRLWKIEATFGKSENIIEKLKAWEEICEVPFNYIDLEKYVIVNFYCPTQKESKLTKEFIEINNGKFFISETKNF